MFLTSTLVPYSACPTGRTDTLASQRNAPSSMLPVDDADPAQDVAQLLQVELRPLRGKPMSGADTISMSGTPARFTSIRL